MRLLKPLLAPLLVLGYAAVAFATDDVILQPCVNNLGVSLVDVLRMAFGFPDYLINGPAWMWRVCLDIEWPSSIKKPSFKGKGVSPDVYRPPLQRELTSKFQLSAHAESKLRDVWLLMRASDGRGLKIHQVACENGSVSEYYTAVKAIAVPLSLVADSLSSTLRRPVIDQTALGGCFTFDLSWSGYSPPNPAAKAVADQLGLELEAAKRPVDILIIDHIEKWPSDQEKK